MKASYQTTLRSSITLSGAGVHSGKIVRLTLHPAEANHGIVFLRTGIGQGKERLIEARYHSVCDTQLCTVIGQGDGVRIGTIEHLMAALAGLGIDNLLIEIDGNEVPILDGSSALFVAAIDEVGLVPNAAPRRFLRVLRSVKVGDERGYAELHPAESGFSLDITIDFDTPVIGRQRRILDLSPQAFRKEIARARTFGFMSDVERLRKQNLARGASLENTIALSETGIVNPEGLRFSDEFVRHKMLDAIGDLALAGSPLIGEYRSWCGGHRLNVGILEALFSNRANYTFVDALSRRDPPLPAGERMPHYAQPVFAPDL
jgi:UDP-3-O-[3-hydroxymyristoyl] N-acetylglucosamine deacetylase